MNLVRKKYFWRDWAAVLILGACGLEAAGAVDPAPSSDHANILVGIHYFGGWWDPEAGAKPETGAAGWAPEHSKWFDPVDGHDWRLAYPERVPTLGVDNNQETMTREIAAAADHGVDYFAILWYPRVQPASMARASRPLNRSVGDFIHSPNAGRMKFYLEICNDGKFDDFTEEQWNSWIPEWVEAMKSSSYLRVGGRLVFVLHDANGFYFKNCRRDLTTIQRRLATLRQKVREAGLGELVLGGGNMGVIQKKAWSTHVIDFSTSYMAAPKLPVTAKPYPYEQLADYLSDFRRSQEKDAIPYLPPLAAGWDARPWHGENRPSFLFPTRAEWIATLMSIAEDLEKSDNLGIPRPDGTVQKSFVIYAWNEFGEGGIMAPTVGEGDMKLKGIQAVFGVKAAASSDPAK